MPAQLPPPPQATRRLRTGGPSGCLAALRSNTAKLWQLLMLGAVVLLAAPQPAQAQTVAVDGTSSQASVGAVSTMSWSHTVGTGENRLLVVGLSINNPGSQTVSYVRFNGVDLTRLIDRTSGSTAFMQMWYMVAPPSGTYTVSVSFSKAQAVGGAISFTGVNQSVPLGTPASATSTSTSPSVTVASAAGELVVDVLMSNNATATAATAGANQTQRWNAANNARGAASTEPGAGSVTMSWDLATARDWALGAVSVRPALANDAQFISQSVPACMVAGQTYAASVRMKNAGSNTWTSAAGYKLGSQNMTGNWGISRVNLPASVAPGEEAIFNFNVTPSHAGPVDFRWRMLQETNAWFGASSTNAAPVVGSRSLAPVADAYVRGGEFAAINYGTESVLAVKLDSDANFNRQSFLRFDTGAVTGALDRADLCLNGKLSDPGSLAHSVHSVSNNTWSETGITWNNKPVLGGALDTVTIDDAINWQWYTWSTTAYLQSERNAGRTNINLAADRGTSHSAVLSIQSRESSSQPKLLLTLVNDAQFVTQSVPASMSAGGTYSVSVTFRNTGTSTWTSADGYKLGSQNPRDNTTWGFSRVSLPASVAPGAEVTFTVDVTAPSTAGSHEFQWRMVRESVEWFGDQSTNVSVTVTTGAGGFNAYDTGTAAGAATGMIQTKVAGSTISVAIVALNDSKSAIMTSFTGNVKVEVLDASNNTAAADANNCRSSWTPIQTLATQTFAAADNGRKDISFSQNNAFRNVRVRVSFPATGTPTSVGCSSDNFAIRPSSLGISVTDANWTSAGTSRTLNNTSASGAIVHRANYPFRISAAAYNGSASPAVTSNYNGTPTALITSCRGVLGDACMSAPVTSITLGSWSASAGTVTTTTASWSGLGAFFLQLQDATFASVDSGDGTPASQLTISSTPIGVGRFVPHRFIVSNASIRPRSAIAGCSGSSFTYLGEQMTATFTLTAVNSNGIAHGYYDASSGLARLDLSNPAVFNFVAINGTGNTPLTARIAHGGTSGTWTGGSATITAIVSINRGAAPDGPYDSVRLGIAPVDLDGVPLDPVAFNLDADNNGAQDSAALGATTGLRFGRLRLRNAVGSELAPLVIPLETQYWNGTAFVTNTADSCTSLAPANIALGNYQKNLAPGETSITLGGAFESGVGSLHLSAPGAGNNGSVDLSANLAAVAGGASCTAGMPATTPAAAAYLQGAWCGTTFNRDPTARATFGLYRQSDQVFYRKENF